MKESEGVVTTATIHRVTFLSPGTFVSEQTTRDLPAWDLAMACEMSTTIVERHGAKPYAFYFTTLLTAPDVPDGRGGSLPVQPREIERSGLHFLNGKVLSVADVAQRNDPSDRTLLDNMTMNDWPLVCETRNGYRHVGPFTERDVVVDASGTITQRGDRG